MNAGVTAPGGVVVAVEREAGGLGVPEGIVPKGKDAIEAARLAEAVAQQVGLGGENASGSRSYSARLRMKARICGTSSGVALRRVSIGWRSILLFSFFSSFAGAGCAASHLLKGISKGNICSLPSRVCTILT